MAIPKSNQPQVDFSAGQIDPEAKRSDSPVVRAGVRQGVNARIRDSRGLSNRFGRSIQHLQGGRTEEVLMAAGTVFRLCFENSILKVRNAAGAIVFTSGAMPWSTATVGQIVFVQVAMSKTVYICYPGMLPQVLTWDGVSTWSIGNYAETVTGNQKRTAFYRLSPQGVTMQPSATFGSVTLSFSAGMNLQAGHVGTRMRYLQRQLLITGVTNATTATATVEEALPSSQSLAFASDPSAVFSLGDEVTGATSQASGIVTAITISTVVVQLIGGTASFQAEVIVGPAGRLTATSASGATSQVLTFGVDPATVFSVSDTVLQNGSIASGTVTSIDSANKKMTVLLGGATLFTAPDYVYKGNSQVISFASAANTAFNVGDTVSGTVSGATATVSVVSGNTITVISLGGHFVASETVGGGSVGLGALNSTAASNVLQASSVNNIFGQPQPITVWDDEVINTFRGWPQSVFFDQNRLGFCNIPSLPNAVIWSANGLTGDLYPGANPDDAMVEIIPSKAQVLFVMAGPESSEFVFCDNGLYYIPISPTNPLKPGSVQFLKLSGDGAAAVQPRILQDAIIYVNAGQTTVRALLPTGSNTRPFDTRDITELHAGLFNTPVAIACPAADASFPERYFYVVNGDGTLAVGRYVIKDKKLDGPVGWVPWSGAGAVKWASALGSTVLFNTIYQPGSVGAVEKLDATQYVDAGLAINAPPAAMAQGGGQGPIWWLPSGTIDLMNGVAFMGTYAVDASGNIVPNTPGEDLTGVSIIAGKQWLLTVEPMVFPVQGGPDVGQRAHRRKIKRASIAVKDSTGFAYDGQRISPWFGGDNPDAPPPLREDTYRFRPRGRSFDPRKTIIKDYPGPLTVVEIDLEVTP